MPNVHVHLHVSNLERSRAFYERFLGATPVKVKPDYVKFLPAIAPLNLALTAGAEGPGPARAASAGHFGFQVDTRERVTELLAQARAAGLEIREEMATDCCYANQDKFWVVDPDGVEWEVYHLNYDVEPDETAASSNAGCCTPLAKLGRRETCEPA